MTKTKALTLFLALFALAMVLPSGAFADTISVTSGCGAATTTPTATGLNYTGTCGAFSFSGSVAGTPPLPEGNLSSSSLDISSTGGGTLDLHIVESGGTSLNGAADMISGFTTNLNLLGGITGVTEYTSANGSTVACQNFGVATATGCGTALPLGLLTASSSSTNAVTLSGSNTFDNEYIITATSAGSVSGTISLTLPEPASLSLVGFGLLGLGTGLRRKLLKN